LKTKYDKLDESSSSSSEDEEEEEEEEEDENEEEENEAENEENKSKENNVEQKIDREERNPGEEDNMDIKEALSLFEATEAELKLKQQQQQKEDGSGGEELFSQESKTNYKMEIDPATKKTVNDKEDIDNDNYNSSTNSNSPEASTSPFLGGGGGGGTSSAVTHSVTIKSMHLKKSIQPINQIFAADDEDARLNEAQQKRAKLEMERKQNAANAEERKKQVKKLVESIPTDRDELFAYQVDWEQLDESLMEKRIRPWINKKIIEYIGEEEATLNDFICSKIQQRTRPDKLLEEVKVILDDEAELFVKKMWRLIVYETESKRCGLSK